MKILEDIFILLGQFNESKEAEELEEENIKDVISKYPEICKLFEKYVSGKIDEVEANELYFLISKSKTILAALNQYYNERLSEIVLDEMEREETYTSKVLINLYNKKLVSPYQYLEFQAVAADEDYNRFVFLKLPFENFELILSIKYKDENYKEIESIRFMAIALQGLKYDEDTFFEIEVKINTGIVSIKLKLGQSLVIDNPLNLYYIKYKDKSYEFSYLGNIREKEIQYWIEYKNAKKEESVTKEAFIKFLKDEFNKLKNDPKALYNLFSKNKYIKIILNDKEMILGFNIDYLNDIDKLVEIICNELNVNS